MDAVKDLKDKHHKYLSSSQALHVGENKKEVEKKHKIQIFNDKVNKSHDLADQLQDLSEFLKEQTSSTAVYIGKLVNPKRRIEEDDDDKAHLDEGAEKIIHYIHSTKGHEFLVDKVLKQEQGLTFEVFKDDEPVEEEAPAEEEQDEEGNIIVKPPKPVLEQFPKFVHIPEVVREPRMHYFKVPKLGSYLAVRLEYESCLMDTALDAAVGDYLEIKQRVKEQEEEKKQYYDKMQDDKEQKDEEGVEDVKIEDKQWDEIKPRPFDSVKVQYAVCLNTMGQDRPYSDEE